MLENHFQAADVIQKDQETNFVMLILDTASVMNMQMAINVINVIIHISISPTVKVGLFSINKNLLRQIIILDLFFSFIQHVTVALMAQFMMNMIMPTVMKMENVHVLKATWETNVTLVFQDITM